MSEVGFLVGRTVVEVRANPDGTRIIFERGDKPEPALYADVGDLTYEDAHGNSRILASFAGRVVAEVSTDGGTLALSFTDGSLLRCQPDPDYEAWQVVGGTPQYLVLCTPGGELAIWDSSYVQTEREAIGLVGRDGRIREITETGRTVVEPIAAAQEAPDAPE